MTIRAPVVLASAALVLAVLGVAGAAARHAAHPANRAKSAAAARSAVLNSEAAIRLATSGGWPTWVNENACVLTNACAPAVDPDTAPVDALS